MVLVTYAQKAGVCARTLKKAGEILKERIRRLALGKLDDRKPQIEIEQTQIEAVIPYGGSYQGEILVRSTNRASFRGLIYTGDSRIALKQQFFAGESALLTYEVKGRTLESGEDIVGAFEIICNGGEFTVPYRFTAGEPGGLKYGALTAVEDFAEFARTDQEQALRLFCSNEFMKLFFMQDLKLQALCDGLRRGSSPRRAMEEFLTASGAKPRVEYRVDESPRSFVYGGGSLSGSITVRRSSWGYTALRVETDAPFIGLKKSALTDADFAAASAEVEFRIYPEKLHAGNNLGRITVFNSRVRFEVPVSVSVAQTTEERARREGNLRYQRQYIRLLRKYIDITAGRGGTAALAAEMEDAWTKMSGLSIPDVFMRMWQVEIMRLSGNRARAARALDAMEPELERVADRSEDAKCCWLYLKMSLEQTPESKQIFTDTLDACAEKGVFTPTIAMLRMRLAEDGGSPKDALNVLREYYRQGLRSPFLYQETCRIFNKFPNSLRRLGAYELQAVWYGARTGCLDRPAALQAASLSPDEIAFRPLYFRALEIFYERWQDQTVLEAICRILIRGDRRGEEYFKWFAAGVASDVRLTRLYDYYLYCLPEDFITPLPAELLLYYSYNSPSDVTAKERLYSNILQNYNDNSEMFASYEKQMQSYCTEQLLKGRVNRDLAQLYRRMVVPEIVDRKMARTLPDILKSCEVTTESDTRTAVVCCGELTGEKLYPLKGGTAIIPVYTDSYCILLADAHNVRCASLPCRITPLFTKKEAAPLLRRCLELLPEMPMLRLAACESYLRSKKLDAAGISMLETQLQTDGLRPAYQSGIVSTLVSIFSTAEGENESRLLACVKSRSMGFEDRVFLTESLIDKKYFAEAVELVRRSGVGGLRPESLRRLVVGWVAGAEASAPGRGDAYLTEVAHRVFKDGFDDPSVLSYLCRYYNGLSRDMLELLRRSISNRAARYDLAGRLLSQKLFTGDYEAVDDVFRCYTEDGPADEMVVRAFFTVKSAEYVFSGEKIDREIMGYIREKVRAEYPYGDAADILKLAVVKDFSENVELSEEDAALAKGIVEDFVRSGRIFAFFRTLGRMVPVPDELCDKSVVEYIGSPDEQPELVYRIIPAKREDSLAVAARPYATVPMTKSFEGIFVRPVLLFDGEKLEYEVRVERGGESVAAAKGVTGPEPAVGVRQNRFRCLNRLVRSIGDAESDKWQASAEEFAVTDTLVEKLFGIR